MARVRPAVLALWCVSACAAPAKNTASALEYPKPSASAPILPRAQAPASTTTPAAPPNAPPPKLPTRVESFGDTSFGGQGAALLERASPDGRWLAVCRAKVDAREREPNAKGASERDAVERFLLSPGEELAIDGFLSASRDGRFAIFLQHGALVLWDSATQASLDLSALGADARLSAESGAAVRTVDFDARSEHLLYVRQRAERTRVVIRDLNSGGERELDPGPGEVWRARFDPGGVYAILQLIHVDTNRNRKLDFPAPLLSAPRACGEDRAHFHTWEGRGDRPETLLLPLDGAAAVHDPDLLMPVRDALLLRDEDGVLSLSRGGKKRVLEPAACKG
ncbi:MAG TPA: hypothetical protein VGM44_11120, partial [Polyangiaceae bacterium]